MNRRTLLATIPTVAALRTLPVVAQDAVRIAFSYPIAIPGRPLGDDFLVRHGYATENIWYNPGWWHTGGNSTGTSMLVALHVRRQLEHSGGGVMSNLSA